MGGVDTDGGGTVPESRCIHRLFRAQAARSPDAAALAWDGGTLTFAELDARAGPLANLLRRRGVRAGGRVGFCLERGPEAVVAMLATLKAGAAYVPLDPSYPAERLAYMLADSGASTLVTERRHLPLFPAAAAVVLLDEAAGALAAEPIDDPGIDLGPDALAYVIYTSGSTGRPKGAAVPHRAVVRLVRGGGFADLGPEQVFLQHAPIAFDAATLEVWAPLLNGGRLAIHPPTPLSPAGLGEVLRRHGVTTLWLTAGLFHLCADEDPRIFSGVKQLLAGGDVLSVPHARRVLRVNPGLTLINGYGPTENTTFTTCHTVRPADLDGASLPIGVPVARTTAYVVDAEMRRGAEGELLTGGEGLAWGYLGRPALTAERWIPDSFSGVPGARLYRTGDQVRRRADGALDFVGRIDGQVKVRGFRVEPGEIEAVLRADSRVRHAVVTAYGDSPGDRRLAAYVVPRAADAGADLLDELRLAVRERLPEYMVPSVFVPLERLPLSPNGKVDRGALPAPAAAARVRSAAYVAPRNPTEEVLAAIWGEVLGVARIGIHDDLFALGAHSLAAMRVAARLREAMGVELPLAVLFANATVASLARAAFAAAADVPDFPPVTRTPHGTRIPASLQQESVCFLQQLAPESLSYHFQAALTLRGELRPDLLERALTEIVRRHEILRTAFPCDAAGPYQRVEAPWEVRLPVVDFTDLPAGARAAAVEAWIATHLREPFDLARAPLIRWTLLRVAPDEHVLFDTEHHLVHDGWSLHVLLGELVRLYRAYLDGEPSPLPALPVQFGDFAVWQRAWMRSPAARAQLDYWQTALAGHPGFLDLPTDRPRPPAQRFRGAAPRFHLPGALYAALKALARREGTTLFMTMLATFDVLLSRYAGEDDVAVASGLAARRQREVEGLIGMFVNAVALRVDLSGDPTFRELLARVRRVTLGAYAHQDVPFEAVVAAVGPERDASRNPLVQVGFSFHDSALPDLALPGLELELEVGLANGSAKFDMQLIVIPHAEQRLGRAGRDDDGITVIWEYDRDLFDAATVERMFAHYQALLEHAAAEPGLPISALSMAAPGELPGDPADAAAGAPRPSAQSASGSRRRWPAPPPPWPSAAAR